MSQSSPPPAAPPGPVQRGVPRPRYQRSTGGLIGAMLITVVGVVAFVGIRSLTGDNTATPVRAVDYTGLVQTARADRTLQVLAPSLVPKGWTVTSALYPVGKNVWHLGMLTDDGKYVGVEESRAGISSMVEQHVDPDATQGKDVTFGGFTWQTWTDSGRDYAVSRSLTAPDGQREHLLVVGSASPTDVRLLAGRLQN